MKLAPVRRIEPVVALAQNAGPVGHFSTPAMSSVTNPLVVPFLQKVATSNGGSDEAQRLPRMTLAMLTVTASVTVPPCTGFLSSPFAITTMVAWRAGR